MVIDAIVRNIEIIGEAASKIPEDVQRTFPSIPWKQLKGIRNRIIHEYFAVDISIIRFIAKNEITPLKIEFQRAVQEYKSI